MRRRRSVRKVALLGLVLVAASTCSRADACFAVKVTLNGKAVAGPEAVTFATKEWKKTVAVAGGCIAVPADVKEAKSVDVVFSVAKSRVNVSSIATGFFGGPWDVELEDESFGKDVKLRKGVRAKDACVVTLHVGEPETVVMVAPCRTPE
jgi:hypothetical protein